MLTFGDDSNTIENNHLRSEDKLKTAVFITTFLSYKQSYNQSTVKQTYKKQNTSRELILERQTIKTRVVLLDPGVPLS